MKFWKLHGIGNDFVAIDGRFDNKEASDYSEYAKAVCHRKFSVGADGLLVVKNSDNCDVEMVYYNADGSRAAMCGNGLRCFVKFVYDNNIVRKEEFSVNTLDGVKKVKINLKGEEIDTIKVNMGNGSFLCEDIPAISNNKVFIGENIDVLDKNFEVNAMLMGVPHVVILVDDISIEEVCKYGPLLEKNKNLIKRLIGVPGDTIEFKNNVLYINGQQTAEDYLSDEVFTADYGPLTVPEDMYFMCGDNRQYSSDSRSWGLVSKEQLIGKGVAIYWPIKDLTWL